MTTTTEQIRQQLAEMAGEGDRFAAMFAMELGSVQWKREGVENSLRTWTQSLEDDVRRVRESIGEYG